MPDRGSLLTSVLVLPLGVTSSQPSTSLLVVSSLLVAVAGSSSITGEVIAAVRVFIFEGPGRKLSRLQQLAAALFLSLSRCSRRPIIIKRIDLLAFSNAVKFTSKTDKIHVHAYPLPDVARWQLSACRNY